MNIKKLSFDVLLVLIGVILIGFGSSFFLIANIGSDPITVFADGFHVLLNISVGSALTAMSIIVIVIVFFIQKKHIGIGTLIAGILTGYFVDVGCLLFQGLISDVSGIYIRVALVLAGCVIMALGIALYVVPAIGVGFMDLIILIIMDLKKVKYKKVKMMLDFVCVIVGFALHGVVGIATFVALCTVGPFAQVFMNILQPVIDNIHKSNG